MNLNETAKGTRRIDNANFLRVPARNLQFAEGRPGPPPVINVEHYQTIQNQNQNPEDINPIPAATQSQSPPVINVEHHQTIQNQNPEDTTPIPAATQSQSPPQNQQTPLEDPRTNRLAASYNPIPKTTSSKKSSKPRNRSAYTPFSYVPQVPVMFSPKLRALELSNMNRRLDFDNFMYSPNLRDLKNTPYSYVPQVPVMFSPKMRALDSNRRLNFDDLVNTPKFRTYQSTPYSYVPQVPVRFSPKLRNLENSNMKRRLDYSDLNISRISPKVQSKRFTTPPRGVSRRKLEMNQRAMPTIDYSRPMRRMFRTPRAAPPTPDMGHTMKNLFRTPQPNVIPDDESEKPSEYTNPTLQKISYKLKVRRFFADFLPVVSAGFRERMGSFFNVNLFDFEVGL